MTLLSTTAEDDLAVNNNGLVRFSSELPGIPEEKYLSFKNQWYIGSQHGCSCGFRHLYTSSVELGFGEPQEWYSEEASDIEATLQVIAIIRKLVERGELVDCVDAWAHGQETAEPLEGDLEIDLAKINDPSFRFFENRRFLFLNQA